MKIKIAKNLVINKKICFHRIIIRQEKNKMEVAQLIEQLEVVMHMYEKYVEKYHHEWQPEELTVANALAEKLQIFSWHLNRYDCLKDTTTISVEEEDQYHQYFEQIDNYSFSLMKKLDTCLYESSLTETEEKMCH
jgi:hypothetical protein